MESCSHHSHATLFGSSYNRVLQRWQAIKSDFVNRLVSMQRATAWQQNFLTESILISSWEISIYSGYCTTRGSQHTNTIVNEVCSPAKLLSLSSKPQFCFVKTVLFLSLLFTGLTGSLSYLAGIAGSHLRLAPLPSVATSAPQNLEFRWGRYPTPC